MKKTVSRLRDKKKKKKKRKERNKKENEKSPDKIIGQSRDTYGLTYFVSMD